MGGKRKPLTLQKLCQLSFLKYLYGQVCKWENSVKSREDKLALLRKVKEVRCFLKETLNRILLNDYISTASSYFKDTRTKYGDLITYTIFVSDVVNEFSLKAKHIVWRRWKIEEKTALVRCLECGSNLTTVNIPGKCTNKILKVLAKNARKLQRLDVSYSRISDEGLLALCGIEIVNQGGNEEMQLDKVCESTTIDGASNSSSVGSKGNFVSVDYGCTCLKVIDLTDTQYRASQKYGITIQGVVSLLMYLSAISIIHYEYLGEALEAYSEIHESKNCPSTLNLVQCIDFEPSQDSVNTALKFCPNVRKVELNTINMIDDCIISALLPKFSKLSFIHLIYYDFNDVLKSAICECGERLEALKLTHLQSIRFSDLLMLKESCPKLKLLELEVDIFVKDADLTAKTPDFVNMKQCKLSGTVPNGKVIDFLLRNATKLETFVVVLYETVKFFNDQFLIHIFETHKLPSLKGLSVESVTLTVASVQYIIHNCPQVQHLGMLSEWNMRDVEFARLKKYVKSENIDIIFDSVISGDYNDDLGLIS